jgi:L-rhamnose-H+ transport protein
MSDHFWLGMVIIFVSGVLNGSFPVPLKYTRQWRWENTWLAFTTAALLLLPCLLATGFVPHLQEIYRGVSRQAFLYPLLFGFLWGIAQVTFGLGINAVGMALAFAVVAGLSCLFGSLVPLLVLNPTDLLRPRGILLLVSMPILFVGLILYGAAGRRREKEQNALSAPTGEAATSFMTGLAICIFTGIFGSNINLGFAFSGDVVNKSVQMGASPVTATYSVWALVLGAGFIPNLLYCCRLLFRHGTWSSFTRAGWVREIGLAIAMALLWLSGIVGYGIGATLVGRYGTSLGYALFIAAMILSSNLLGIATGEWKATSARTRKVLAVGVAVILISVVVLNLGGLF